MRIRLLIAAALSIGACAGSLPTYEPLPADETWLALGRQASATCAATGEVTLWTDAGRATLRCAIVSDSAGSFRLRAWKLDQAVLDITLAGGDLWIYSAQQEADFERLRAADIARAWSLVSGTVFDTPPPEASAQDGAFEYHGPGDMRITVDRATRTPRAFEADAPEGALRLELSRFALVDERPFPMRIDLSSGDRRARISLDTVQLDAPPPPGAFVPPGRATRVARP